MQIEKQTLTFLTQLRKNNNREWFLENKEQYEAALANVKHYISELITALSEVDPHINTDIQPGRCLFRIYRDIRFSKDKTPYKTWFSAGISVDGRKLAGPEYYLHIEPGKHFIAAGYWRPDKEHLQAIRQEIDYNYEEFLAALHDGNWTCDNLSSEDKLKRAPAGYQENDPHIEILKLKSFILWQPLSDEEICSTASLSILLDAAKRMLPFKAYIHQAIDQ